MKSQNRIFTPVLFTLFLFSSYGQAQRTKKYSPQVVASNSSSRVAALEKRLEKGNQSALAQFWEEVKRTGTPFVESIPGDKQNLLVTFVWRGDKDTRNVVIFSQAGGGNPADNQMTRLSDTDVWYRSYVFRRDVRFLYSLSPNDDLTPLNAPNTDWSKRFANVQTDPLNPKRYPPTAGATEKNVQSVVELPGAPHQLWVARRAEVPAGKIEKQTVKSSILSNERNVWIYLPANYRTRGKPYTLLILFDGQSYLDLVPTPAILDNLIAAGKIPPTLAVLVDNPTPADRELELACHRPFADFLVKELLPWAREKYHVTDDPGSTVIAGSSYGGLAATCSAMWYPENFGNVLSQSASYYWKPDSETEYEWVRRQFSTGPKLPIHFFVSVGLLETLPKPGKTNQVEVNRSFRDALKAKGYEIKYTEFDGAHEYINWQGTLADGLIALLGKQTR